MSIDLNKLKGTLEEAGILIIDYYLLEGKCAMLKTFMYESSQFLFIYIPTKLRSEVKNKNNIYELKALEDVVDEEDYAKFDECQINFVKKKAEKDTYKNMAQKYNKQIVLNGDGVEQYEKRIMRQVKRLNIPFSKLEHTVGIQNKKIMALHFGEEINLFYIKNYTKDIRCYMYIVNVKELIENITEIQYEIDSINKQFFTIIYDIIRSNMNELSVLNKSNYDSILSNFEKQKDIYMKKTSTDVSVLQKLTEEEKTEIKKYKALFTKETSNIRKGSLETEYQNAISSYMRKKVEKIEAIVENTYIFQIFFLLLEEISFDNFIMLKRTTTNFEKLNALFI